jgi:hypothetical protein
MSATIRSLDIAGVSEGLAKCAQWFRKSFGRLRVEGPAITGIAAC